MAKNEASVRRRLVASWVLYDFANSSYALVIPAALFPLYLSEYVLRSSPTANLVWGLLTGLSVLFAAFLGPVLGAGADGLAKRVAVFRWTTMIAVLGTALLGIPSVSADPWIVAGVFFIGAVAFGLSISFYDSFLPVLAERTRAGTLSGAGWGMGYLGGVATLAAIYPVVGGNSPIEAPSAYQLSFLITASFFLVFALPALLFLPETDPLDGTSKLQLPTLGLKRAWQTVRNFRQHREAFLFLAGFYFLTDGITALYYFTTLYARQTLHMGMKDIMVLLTVVQVVGIPASAAAGWLADRISPMRVIFSLLGLWGTVTLIMAVADSRSYYYGLAVLLGLALGPIQAVARSTYAQLIPEQQRAEFFGFNGFASKVSATIAPILFGLVSSGTGSQRAAVLTNGLFFVLALVMFWKVKLPKGRPEEPAASAGRITSK